MLDRAFFLAALVLPVLAGCGAVNRLADKDVEIAPGEWITVNQWSTQLVVPWGDKTLKWKEDKDETPISLREWENKLFLVTFDRSNFSQIRFRYYMEDGNGFKEVRPDEYPKRIATQNLWLKVNGRVKTRDLELALKLDPEDIEFCDSLTGKIWYQLMTGKEFWEAQGAVTEKLQPLVREYSKKYEPIKLTTILREWEQTNREPEPEKTFSENTGQHDDGR